MAKKERKNKKPSEKWKMYEFKDGKLIRKNPISLKEGAGIFMAKHKDRVTCGKSGYTEFKTKEKKAEE
tara:strand:+ start:1880 stop:2083 length:204 start_codon:yes stop_codon:yes gene_type:complete